MRIKLTLFPAGRRAALPISYNYFLTGLIYRIIHTSSKDYSRFLHDEGYKLPDSRKGFKLFTYSMLRGEKYRIKHEKIDFSGGRISWEISSPVEEFIRHLVTGVFSKGQEIDIGPEQSSIKLLIERVETLPQPEFKDVMKFTCLSPVTVSKAVKKKVPDSSTLIQIDPMEQTETNWDKLEQDVKLEQTETIWNNMEQDVNLEPSGTICHYIRPWEEGFSEAIKNNLLKKYMLIHGKRIDDPEFKIKINSDYMNKRNGKITKNINFKGTNIIGFMAPFEVSGNPELIRVGYEAGFGEKGSMGFGMVR